jgi:hypothetical protein
MKNKLKNLLFLSFLLSLFSYSCTEQEEYVNDDEILLETIGAEIQQLELTPETRANLEVKEKYSGADYFLKDVLNTDLRAREGGKLYVTATFTKHGETESISDESVYEYNSKNGYFFFSNNPIKIKKDYEVKLNARFQVDAKDVKKEDAAKISTKSYIYTKDVLVGDTFIFAGNTLNQKENITNSSSKLSVNFNMKHNGILIQLKLLNYDGKQIKSVIFDGVEMYDYYKNKGEYFLIVNPEKDRSIKEFELNYEDGKETSFSVNFNEGLESEKIYVTEIDLFDPNGKITMSTIDWIYSSSVKKIESQISIKPTLYRVVIKDEDGRLLNQDIKVYKAKEIGVKSEEIVFSEENVETISFDSHSKCYFVSFNKCYLTKIIYGSCDPAPYYCGIKSNESWDSTMNLSFDITKNEWLTVKENGITTIASITDFFNIYKTSEIKNNEHFIQTRSIYFTSTTLSLFNTAFGSVNFESSIYEGIDENTKIFNSVQIGFFATSNNSKFKNFCIDHSIFMRRSANINKENMGLLINKSENTIFENCVINKVSINIYYRYGVSITTANVGFFSGRSKNDTYYNCNISNSVVEIFDEGNNRETKFDNLFSIQPGVITLNNGNLYSSYKSSPATSNLNDLYSTTPRINFGLFVGNGANTKIYDSHITDVTIATLGAECIYFLSGVIGFSANSLFENFKMDKLYINSGAFIAGGYVGKEISQFVCNNSSIENSIIEGKYVGGFVGLDYGPITINDKNIQSEINYFTSKNLTVRGSGVVGGVFGILSAICKITYGNSDNVKLDFTRGEQGTYESAISMGGLIGYYIPSNDDYAYSDISYALIIEEQDMDISFYNSSFYNGNDKFIIKEPIPEIDDGRYVYYGALIGDATLFERIWKDKIRMAYFRKNRIKKPGTYYVGAMPVGRDYSFFYDCSNDYFCQQTYTDATKYKDTELFTVIFNQLSN